MAGESTRQAGATPADAMPPASTAFRLATAIVFLQALALALGALVLAVMTLVDHPDGVGRALGIVAFALVGAAVLAACARGLHRLRASARTPVFIIEFLALPVTYSLGIQAGRYAIGLPIMITAAIVLVLLFMPRSRQVLDRNPFGTN